MLSVALAAQRLTPHTPWSPEAQRQRGKPQQPSQRNEAPIQLLPGHPRGASVPWSGSETHCCESIREIFWGTLQTESGYRLEVGDWRYGMWGSASWDSTGIVQKLIMRCVGKEPKVEKRGSMWFEEETEWENRRIRG